MDNACCFQALLLRAETREKHPGSDEAAGHLDGEELSLEERAQQAAETANENEADQSLSCVRSQGRNHRGRHNGSFLNMLGTLLLRKYRRRVLQDLHISPGVPSTILLFY